MTPRKPTRAKQLGVSDDEYARLLAAQGGHCAVCPSKPKTRRLHTDHDHATGKVRGLLCFRCNRFLLTYNADPERLHALADYLDAHNRRKQLLALIPDDLKAPRIAGKVAP